MAGFVFQQRFQFFSEVGVVVVAFEAFGADAKGTDEDRAIGVGRCLPVGLGVVGDHHAESLSGRIGKYCPRDRSAFDDRFLVFRRQDKTAKLLLHQFIDPLSGWIAPEHL